MQFSAEDIELNQTNDVQIAGLTATGDLTVSSADGDITSLATAEVSAVGSASFTVDRDDADVDLSESTNSFGDVGASLALGPCLVRPLVNRKNGLVRPLVRLLVRLWSFVYD